VQEWVTVRLRLETRISRSHTANPIFSSPLFVVFSLILSSQHHYELSHEERKTFWRIHTTNVGLLCGTKSGAFFQNVAPKSWTKVKDFATGKSSFRNAGEGVGVVVPTAATTRCRLHLDMKSSQLLLCSLAIVSLRPQNHPNAPKPVTSPFPSVTCTGETSALPQSQCTCQRSCLFASHPQNHSSRPTYFPPVTPILHTRANACMAARPTWVGVNVRVNTF
jgi:hypothetical protein